VERERSIATNFRWVTTIDTEERRYVQFFVEGSITYFGFDFRGWDIGCTGAG
jgi:peptide/nickel transport system permease protein